MSTTWILVANAAEARLFSNEGPRKGLRLVKEFAHPESREKGSALVSDRPGHNPGAGNGHGSFVPATDPRQNEADSFALQLARELDQGRAGNVCQRAILVAAPAFLGLLNKHLSSPLKTVVSDTVQKDYTKATERDLVRHLEDVILL